MSISAAQGISSRASQNFGGRQSTSVLNDLSRSSIDTLRGGNTRQENQTVDTLKRELQDQAPRDPAGFRGALQNAYGGKATPAEIDQLLDTAISGKLPLPAKVQFVDAGSLGGTATGAYNKDNGGTVYLDRQLLNQPTQLREVFTEEVGHHLDAQLGGSDAKGDEGAIFSQTLTKGSLDGEALAGLKANNDQGQFMLGGHSVSAEFHNSDDAAQTDTDEAPNDDSQLQSPETGNAVRSNDGEDGVTADDQADTSIIDESFDLFATDNPHVNVEVFSVDLKVEKPSLDGDSKNLSGSASLGAASFDVTVARGTAEFGLGSDIDVGLEGKFKTVNANAALGASGEFNWAKTNGAVNASAGAEAMYVDGKASGEFSLNLQPVLTAATAIADGYNEFVDPLVDAVVGRDVPGIPDLPANLETELVFSGYVEGGFGVSAKGHFGLELGQGTKNKVAFGGKLGAGPTIGFGGSIGFGAND